MAIAEILMWVVSISVVSAIVFLVWLAMMFLSNKTQATTQNEAIKRKSESGNE